MFTFDLLVRSGMTIREAKQAHNETIAVFDRPDFRSFPAAHRAHMKVPDLVDVLNSAILQGKPTAQAAKEGWFRMEPRGIQQVKGRREPIEVFRVLG